MGYIGFWKLGEIRIPKTEVARFLENHMNEDLASEIAKYREWRERNENLFKMTIKSALLMSLVAIVL